MAGVVLSRLLPALTGSLVRSTSEIQEGAAPRPSAPQIAIHPAFTRDHPPTNLLITFVTADKAPTGD